jgi:hypothetical protein
MNKHDTATIIYLAGPYRGDVEKNIAAAREVAVQLWSAGYPTITPHLNTANFSDDCTCTENTFLVGYRMMVKLCDGMVMLPGWEKSEGSIAERKYAESYQIPVWEWPEMPDGMPILQIE